MNIKLLSLFILFAFASTSFSIPHKLLNQQSKLNLRNLQSVDSYELCDMCYNFVEENIQDIINGIIYEGNKTCTDICSKLNSTTYTVCFSMCETVGVTLFVALFDEMDPDPIYICELVRACEINDNGEAAITKVTTNPTSGPQNTTFNVNVNYNVSSTLGTGTIQVQVWAPGLGDVEMINYLLADTAVGEYSQSFQIETHPNAMSNFTAGLYMVDVLICEGSCQSTHPHSKIYNLERSQFVITGNSDSGSGSGSSGGYVYW